MCPVSMRLFNMRLCRQLDVSDLSIIRFGRAAATTAVISYDYLTAFRHVEHGTEQYWALKSKGSDLRLHRSMT
ncbi:hypothetical protein INR49_014223, partial [Caranx melampygus]